MNRIGITNIKKCKKLINNWSSRSIEGDGIISHSIGNLYRLFDDNISQWTTFIPHLEITNFNLKSLVLNDIINIYLNLNKKKMILFVNNKNYGNCIIEILYL